jgi:hypothetical protein
MRITCRKGAIRSREIHKVFSVTSLKLCISCLSSQTLGQDEGHDRMADSSKASGKEAARVSLPESDWLASQSMGNIPEGREQKFRTALARLAEIQPSYVPDLTHGWLEVLNDGVPHATKLAPRRAAGRRIRLPRDEGPIHTPPWTNAYPVKLNNDQVIWLHPSAHRSVRGYKPIVVLDKQQRETRAAVAALTVLEGSISNPEELRNALLLMADLSPDTLEKVWIVDIDESRFSGNYEIVIRELDKGADSHEKGSQKTADEKKWVRGLDKYARGLEKYRQLRSLSYLAALLRYYRPEFDQYSWEYQLALMERACIYLHKLLEAVRTFTDFLEYGTPDWGPNRSAKTPARDVRATILRDVDGLPYRLIGQELGILPPPDVHYKGDYPTVRASVKRGREILEKALDKDEWSKQVETMKADAAWWKALSNKEKLRETLAEEFGIPSHNQDELVRAIARASAGEPGFSEEEIRRDLF